MRQLPRKQEGAKEGHEDVAPLETPVALWACAESSEKEVCVCGVGCLLQWRHPSSLDRKVPPPISLEAAVKYFFKK